MKSIFSAAEEKVPYDFSMLWIHHMYLWGSNDEISELTE